MENIAKEFTLAVSHITEILSALIIALALIQVIGKYVGSLFTMKGHLSKEALRVQFGSSVAVSLELLLGADVLATAVAPGWDAIGKLAAIAILRTALNYFLAKELITIKTIPDKSQAN